MIALDKLFQHLHMPLCRLYLKHFLKDKPADEIMRCLCIPYFVYLHRYWPAFKQPVTFSEKIFHRMLYNRNPVLTQISDKLAVREYVARKVGDGCLIPLLWQGGNPSDIPFDKLPEKFVIKGSHGCGYNIIVDDKTRIDREKIKSKLNRWLSQNFAQDTFLGLAWAYKNIKPTILVESFIDENGRVPLDYKFFCYGGRAEILLMTFDRFGNLEEKHFNRKFQPLDLWNGAPQHEGKIERPLCYEEMLRLADSISSGFDFMRVDLYSVGGHVYFGELTCYPAGGLARFIPREYDFVFGEKWHLF